MKNMLINCPSNGVYKICNSESVIRFTQLNRFNFTQVFNGNIVINLKFNFELTSFAVDLTSRSFKPSFFFLRTDGYGFSRFTIQRLFLS